MQVLVVEIPNMLTEIRDNSIITHDASTEDLLPTPLNNALSKNNYNVLVLKNKEKLMATLTKILEKREEMSQEIFHFKLNQIYLKKKELKHLTVPQEETLRLLVSGYTYQQIAEKMNISINSVKKRISGLYKKIGIHDKSRLCLLFDSIKIGGNK
jgi:DNA-binding NarL/FixJ family response regulator